MPSLPHYHGIIPYGIREIFSISTVAIALSSWLVYLVCLGIYRLYLSPLSKFPGPKLAALTTWYQGYYDVKLRGQYIWRIKEMHEQYGPIVRINPHEIHINDPEYIDEIYGSVSKKRDKYRWVGRLVSDPHAIVGTISHDLHRKRRAPLNPYFSKQSVRRQEPIVKDRLLKLLERMSTFAKSGEVFPLSVAYQALTCDVINEYAFAKSTGYLKQDDFNASYFEAIAAMFELSHAMLHIGWLGTVLKSLPNSFKNNLSPGMSCVNKMRQDWEDLAQKIKGSKDRNAGKDTIFHGILNSNRPEAEKTAVRLREEAQLIVLAGQDTTATTLSAITYHLLANPDIFRKLKAELDAALPDPGILPTASQVEHLPYLTAVIHEGLRLHPAATLRMQRVSPNEHLYYDDGHTRWKIPAGTPMSMTPTLIQTNPRIFPNPHEFQPERWLANPRLDRYLITFSRGTRMCLGINLAYQELYIVLAGLIRKYDLYNEHTKNQGPAIALYGTIRERDVDLLADIAVPAHAIGSKGVRVIVK